MSNRSATADESRPSASAPATADSAEQPRPRRTWRRRILRGGCFLFVLLLISGVVVAYLTAVDTTITAEDRAAIAEILARSNVEPPDPTTRTYEEEVAFIAAAQAAVLAVAPEHRAIPLGQPREPADLLAAGHGFCFDRSRAIEKILDHHGFKVRHAAVYALKDRSKLTTLLTPGVSSHAVTEVKTQRGWMLVDSNHPFIGLDTQGNPIALSELQNAQVAEKVGIDTQYATELNSIFQSPYTYVFGLYSRHGRFYQPYLFVPEVHWGQLMQNW